MKQKKEKILKLAVAIVVCQLAGIIGSIFTSSSVSTWYASLQKPLFNPPNWIFSPVWISLFVLMGISAYLVWEKGIGKKNVKYALSIFALQLVLNVLWSALFFGLRAPFYAFVEIIVLWLAILATIIAFFRISKAAGALLIPYLLWVSFAAVLNFYLWILNI